MPIISISINESLKKFINKLVTTSKYENKSKLIRDALIRLMQSPELSSITDSSGEVFAFEKQSIVGNMICIIGSRQVNREHGSLSRGLIGENGSMNLWV